MQVKINTCCNDILRKIDENHSVCSKHNLESYFVAIRGKHATFYIIYIEALFSIFELPMLKIYTYVEIAGSIEIYLLL